MVDVLREQDEPHFFVPRSLWTESGVLDRPDRRDVVGSGLRDDPAQAKLA